MNLDAIGRLIARTRRENGLTLTGLAATARVGRSTLAALEHGKLSELGYVKIARICAALGLKLEARPLALEAPLMRHRHLTDAAGRDLTKAAIEDVITRGEFRALRGLVQAMRADPTGRVAGRVRDISTALSGHDPRARAFATLLPMLLGNAKRPPAKHA